MSPVLAVLVAFLAIAASAVLALVETSFTRLAAVGTGTLARTHPERAERVGRLLEQPERVLAPALLLTLACHITAATLLTYAARETFGTTGVIVAVILEIFVVFVVAEAIPKSRAFAESVQVAAITAPVAALLASLPVIAPLSRALMRLGSPRRGGEVRPVVSEADLVSMAKAAAEAETIEAEEQTLIESVFEFGDTLARDVMVPRPDMDVVHADATVADALDVVVERGRSRIPVYGEDPDDILGLVLSKDLVRTLRSDGGEPSVRGLCRPPMFVPETKRVAELMPEMQAAKFHMAIVVDEYGGTAGLVTLEDLIEELVGEIVDEFDQEEPLVEDLGDSWRVWGRTPIADLGTVVGEDLSGDDWNTVGGFFYAHLGRSPEPGDEVEASGLRMVAEVVDGNRLERLVVERRRVLADGADSDAGAA